MGGAAMTRSMGMEGHDTLFGEAGRDRFIFDTQVNAANSDVIGDFVSDTTVSAWPITFLAALTLAGGK